MTRIKEFIINDLSELIGLISNDLDILSKYGVNRFLPYTLNEVDLSLSPYSINLMYQTEENSYSGCSSIPYIDIESGVKNCLTLSGPNYMIIYQKVQWFIVSHIFGSIRPV